MFIFNIAKLHMCYFGMEVNFNPIVLQMWSDFTSNQMFIYPLSCCIAPYCIIYFCNTFNNSIPLMQATFEDYFQCTRHSGPYCKTFTVLFCPSLLTVGFSIL